MFKNFTKAPAIPVVSGGNKTTLSLDPGPAYQCIALFATVTKTAATSSFTSASLADALGDLIFKVNTVPKRTHSAVEINEIQTAWDRNLAAVRYDGVDSNFNAVADVTGTINGVANSTSRTSTWVLFIWFAEPTRDQYLQREAFQIPTTWISNGNVVKTANLQLDINVPLNSSVSGANAISQYVSGSTIFSSPNVRAEVATTAASGLFNSSGAPVLPMCHWYRQNEGYSSTNPVIRKWSFIGALAQFSLFSPSGSGDDIAAFKVLKNSVTLMDTNKRTNDDLKLSYNWNDGKLGTTAGDLAGTNWPSADVFHLAFDFDDDPSAWLGYDGSVPFELNLTLAQATASNKNLNILAQVYRDALTS